MQPHMAGHMLQTHGAGSSQMAIPALCPHSCQPSSLLTHPLHNTQANSRTVHAFSCGQFDGHDLVTSKRFVKINGKWQGMANA